MVGASFLDVENFMTHGFSAALPLLCILFSPEHFSLHIWNCVHVKCPKMFTFQISSCEKSSISPYALFVSNVLARSDGCTYKSKKDIRDWGNQIKRN